MSILTFILNALLLICSLFLICLVLIQRGKGGGLAGAFGGVGGSSAFGTKAGDVFTRVTIGVAIVWFVLSMLLVVLNNLPRQTAFRGGQPGTTSSSTTGSPPSAGGSSPAPAGVPAPPEATDKGAAKVKAPISDLPSALEDEPAPASKTPTKPATP